MDIAPHEILKRVSEYLLTLCQTEQLRSGGMKKAISTLAILTVLGAWVPAFGNDQAAPAHH